MFFQQLDKKFCNYNLGMLLYSMNKGKLKASNLTSQQLTELQEVLKDYEEVFVIPSKLPSSKSHDHQIPLLPGVQPPNIRPYHYGPFQKIEIEKVVQAIGG